MLSPTMRTTVLHATTLFTISIMLNHHLGKNMFDQVLEDEGWLNMTSAYNKSAYASTSGTPHGLLPIDAGKPANQTLPSAYGSNGTARKGTLDAYEESFYCGTLPRKVVIFVVVTAIQYWWFLALEKMLPARPSRFQDAVQSEKVLEGGGDREEEVVKRWIAKGRVRRTSLNWCNTFLKWLLDMTVGTLWYHTVEHFVMKVVLKLQSYSGPAPRGLKGQLLMDFIGTYLSLKPPTHLMALIIIPAHQRIVFSAGMDLVETIFYTTLIRILATWAIKTDAVQMAMRGMTDQTGHPRGLHAEL